MSAVDERAGVIARPESRPYADVRKGYTYFEEGDVLFAKITPCMQNGKHAIATDLIDGFGFGSTEFHIIRPGMEVTAEWIHRFVRQPSVLAEATAHFTGSVGQQRVPEQFLASLPIPLPPLPEQRRIAAILGEQLAAVERARAAAQAQLEAANALPGAYLQEVFRTSEEEWPVRELGEVCQIQLGKMLSPASKTGTNSHPYLRNFNVQWGRFDLSDISEMDFSDTEQSKFALRPGDLLVCEGGEPGRSALWEGQIAPCYYQKALHRLRPIDNQVDPYYVLYRLWLGATVGEFADTHAQTTIAHLPAVRLATLPIPVPPREKQHQMADMVKDQMAKADAARHSLEDQLATIDRLPAALLRRAFAGEMQGEPRTPAD